MGPSRDAHHPQPRAGPRPRPRDRRARNDHPGPGRLHAARPAQSGHRRRDEMAVCVEPPEYLLGLREFEHYVVRTQPDGVQSGPGDLDLTVYAPAAEYGLREAGITTVSSSLCRSRRAACGLEFLSTSRLGRARCSTTFDHDSPASENVTRTDADNVTCAGCRSTRAGEALASLTISSSSNDPASSHRPCGASSTATTPPSDRDAASATRSALRRAASIASPSSSSMTGERSRTEKRGPDSRSTPAAMASEIACAATSGRHSTAIGQEAAYSRSRCPRSANSS